MPGPATGCHGPDERLVSLPTVFRRRGEPQLVAVPGNFLDRGLLGLPGGVAMVVYPLRAAVPDPAALYERFLRRCLADAQPLRATAHRQRADRRDYSAHSLELLGHAGTGVVPTRGRLAPGTASRRLARCDGVSLCCPRPPRGRAALCPGFHSPGHGPGGHRLLGPVVGHPGGIPCGSGNRVAVDALARAALRRRHGPAHNLDLPAGRAGLRRLIDDRATVCLIRTCRWPILCWVFWSVYGL